MRPESPTRADVSHAPIPDGLTREEWHAVAHIRGFCHDARDCPMCAAEWRAYEADRRLESVISG